MDPEAKPEEIEAKPEEMDPEAKPEATGTKDAEQKAESAKIDPSASTPGMASSATSSTVPAVNPPCFDAGDGVGSPAKPQIPPREQTDVKVRIVVRAVIAYVKYALKQQLKDNPIHFHAFPDVPLDEHTPLLIREGKDTDLVSYKHPWVQEMAAISLKSTDKYEAAGNLLWINPFPADSHDDILSGDNNSWELVHSMADAFRFSRGASTPLQNKSGTIAKEKRVMFPVSLAVWAPNAEFYTSRVTFPGTMKLVTGHVAVWGWYLAMYEALDAGNTEFVAVLWQAALTVTIQAHIIKERSSLAVLSMSISNTYFVNAKNLADTFPTFARKLHLALSGASTPCAQNATKRLEFCIDKNIRYNSQSVHRNLLFAALKYVEVVDDNAHELVMTIERKYGKDVLGGKWGNLNRLLVVCTKELDAGAKMWKGLTASDLVSHVMHYLIWGLQHDTIKPGDITMEFLDKDRHSNLGIIHRVLAKIQLIRQCDDMVRELPGETKTKTDLENLLTKFQGYNTYNTAFQTDSAASASTPGDADENPDASTLGEASDKTDPFEDLRNGLCKTGIALLDVLFDFFACEYEKELGDLLKKHTGAIALLNFSDLEDEAGKAWRDVVRQLGIHKATVSISEDGGPPSASHRSLKRVLTEEGVADEDDREVEMKKERAEAWKNAQLNRKKLATVCHAPIKTAADIQKLFERQKAAFQFNGKAGESHRVFVFSCDTSGPEGSEPWKNTSETKELSTWLEFMQNQKGPCDVLLSFDGRNGVDRKTLAKEMEKTRNGCEVWVTYKSTKRLGRRVAWASDSREVGWISFPVPRTSIPIKERSEESAEWAESTHDSVYSGVAPVPWDGLPMISASDKARVFGMRISGSTPDESEVTKPPSKIFDSDRGMPLYWAERKPVEFWEDMLWSVDAQMVVDLSPGSGSVGRACLRSGLQYLAVCRTESHAAWVSNILDREACDLIVTNNSPLFEQDLATMIEKHFKDILEQIGQQKNAEDKEIEEETEET